MKKQYDWELWFREGGKTLVRGEDYRCGTASLIQQARNFAAMNGYKISISELSKGFRFTVTDRPAASRKKLERQNKAAVRKLFNA